MSQRREPYQWFRFNIGDWLMSETRAQMSLEAQGAYLNLLVLHYRDGSVPADPVIRAKLLRVSPRTERRVWPSLAHKFRPDADDPARLVNDRCLAELARSEGYREQQSRNRAGSRRDDRRSFGDHPRKISEVLGINFDSRRASPLQSTNALNDGSTNKNKIQKKKEGKNSSCEFCKGTGWRPKAVGEHSAVEKCHCGA